MGRGEAKAAAIDLDEGMRSGLDGLLDEFDPFGPAPTRRAFERLGQAERDLTHIGSNRPNSLIDATWENRDFLAEQPEGEVAKELTSLILAQEIVSRDDELLARHIVCQRWAYGKQDRITDSEQASDAEVEQLLSETITRADAAGSLKRLISESADPVSLYDRLAGRLSETARIILAEQAADSFLAQQEKERIEQLTSDLEGLDRHLASGLRKQINWPKREKLIRSLVDIEKRSLSGIRSDEKRDAVNAAILGKLWPGAVTSYLKSFEDWRQLRNSPSEAVQVAMRVWTAAGDLLPPIPEKIRKAEERQHLDEGWNNYMHDLNKSRKYSHWNEAKKRAIKEKLSAKPCDHCGGLGYPRQHHVGNQQLCDNCSAQYHRSMR